MLVPRGIAYNVLVRAETIKENEKEIRAINSDTLNGTLDIYAAVKQNNDKILIAFF